MSEDRSQRDSHDFYLGLFLQEAIIIRLFRGTYISAWRNSLSSGFIGSTGTSSGQWAGELRAVFDDVNTEDGSSL